MLDVDRDVGKRGFSDTEVQGQHVARRVREQVGDQEGLVLREAPVIENKEELTTVLQALDRMRNNRWEIPQIARTDIIDESASLFVDSGNASVSGDHVRPFGLFMPVHLADATWCRAHVDSGELSGHSPLLPVPL